MDVIDRLIEQTKKIGHSVEVISHLKSGKEADVYRVLLDGELAAMKVYKKPEARDFKNAGDYISGKFYKTASHRKALAKNNKFAKKLKHDNWVKREFFMLQKLFDLGANIPKPFLQIEDAIFMQLLGDEEGVAPRLSDIELEREDAERAFEEVLNSMDIFWHYGIVHADLSAFNILWWNSSPYIIDFPQSVDARTHPEAYELLLRDLNNVVKYFGRYIEIDIDDIRKRFEQ